MTPQHINIPRNQALWQSDFQATKSQDGRWTASQSFLCHSADAVTLTPSDYAPCEQDGYTLLLFSGAQIAHEDGNIARVTCTYSGTNNNEENFEFGNDGKSYTLSRSTSQEPLETHPDYVNAQSNFVSAFKNGSLKAEDEENDGVIEWMLTDTATGEKTDVTSDLDSITIELLTKFSQGITDYYEAGATWTVNIPSRSGLSSSQIAKFGKIVSPVGNPATPTGRDWLFIGASQTRTGGIYDISMSYLLSGRNGWDTDIY